MTTPKFPWLRLIGAVATRVPAVREALQKVASGVDRSPDVLRFIEGFQHVDQKDCIICIGYDLGRRHGFLQGTTPEHWCPTRQNQALCGCGKPGVRQGQHPSMPDRMVCAEFPGCIPKSRASRA